jgi:hypothetical protein
MDIAFAFGGQINWMRYITTMRQRNKFAEAAALTTGKELLLLLLLLLLCCAVFYVAIIWSATLCAV